MAGLSQVIETARRGLASQRTAMNIVGSNIANASTPGYSRQRAELTPTIDLQQAGITIGTGADVSGVQRMRSKFLDQQVRSTYDSLNYAQSQYSVLSQIESIVNEPSDNGVSSALNKFFNSFQALSLHPEDSSARYAVQQQGKLLAQSFKQLRSDINQLRTDIGMNIQAKVTRINELTSEIADMNGKIVVAEAAGVESSVLKDQRDLRVEELSTLAKVSVADEAGGSVAVMIGGTVVASRGGSMQLEAVKNDTSIQIFSKDHSQKIELQSGELGGMLDAYNTAIPGYLIQLDTTAKTLIDRVNQLHSAAYGSGTPPSTGYNFFSGTDASDITLDSHVANDITTIAASGNGSIGDNAAALAIAGVRDEKLLNNGSTTVSDYYNGLVNQIGTDVKRAEDVSKTQELLSAQLEGQRSAVSGVSIDEEMTLMIQYQRSFDAASRMIRTVDEMYQTLLNMV
ncbi:MAG: flagellar hook-associated protein FlgK [Ignavibacteriales bacterium]|nr:flagellar hook-associated protein FlgK [Ignavibacteriales bacterium]